MGRTKALLPYRGQPLAAGVAAALGDGGCDPVVFVGGDAEQLAILGHAVLADRWPGEGPLGGVLSALGAGGALADADSIVIAACDLPSLTGETVRRLVAAPPGAVVIAVGARRHPTLGRWRRDVEAPLEAIFASGERSLIGALEALAGRGIDVMDVAVEERELHNANAPDDLAH